MIRSCRSALLDFPRLDAGRSIADTTGLGEWATSLSAETRPQVQKCLFIVSHPRSGTHLLIDFIRRNFPTFHPELMLWESAAKLYLRLDRPKWQSEISEFRRTHVLVQSHRAGYADNRDIEACDVLAPNTTIYLYPFRRFSRVVKSFAEFRGAAPPISGILKEKDTFFGKASCIAESIHDHAAAWLKREVHFIDCDALIANPEVGCLRLAAVLRERPVQIRRRLPGHKLFAGKLGELIERLRGRQSTEVVVPRKLSWRDEEERRYVDSEFQALYAELATRSLSPSHGHSQLALAV